MSEQAMVRAALLAAVGGFLLVAGLAGLQTAMREAALAGLMVSAWCGPSAHPEGAATFFGHCWRCWPSLAACALGIVSLGASAAEALRPRLARRGAR